MTSDLEADLIDYANTVSFLNFISKLEQGGAREINSFSADIVCLYSAC